MHNRWHEMTGETTLGQNCKLATKFFHRKRKKIGRNLPILTTKLQSTLKSCKKFRKLSYRKEKTSQKISPVCSFGLVLLKPSICHLFETLKCMPKSAYMFCWSITT